MNARLLQTLMRDEFGVTIESGLPMVDDSEIAPGYEEPEESPDQLMVRAGWIENERRKAQTYVDTLQLLKAVESTRLTIDNSEFSKCSDEQKISIYTRLSSKNMMILSRLKNGVTSIFDMENI